jgi:DNA repair exonuclease SbcCD nuclease subunit
MRKGNYRGLLAIGDPHLASRVPGFRKDDYPLVILGKLKWCLNYATEAQLLPCLLGDVFHWPRDNANWLLGAILELLQFEVVAISGNHDCAENSLGDDDSLTVLARAGRIRLLDRTGPWRGTMNGRDVMVGGTPWGAPLPMELAVGKSSTRPLVFWLAHADISFPGYDAGHIEPRPIYGIDAVINGHIHRPRETVVAGSTVWLNPGNIARVKRSDSARESVPCALRVDVDPIEGSPEADGLLWSPPGQALGGENASGRGWRAERIPIPHEAFDRVFHEEVAADAIATEGSSFVHGLAELVARRTESGAGLREFLQQNLSTFDERVAQEIMTLAEEVLENARS